MSFHFSASPSDKFVPYKNDEAVRREFISAAEHAAHLSQSDAAVGCSRCRANRPRYRATADRVFWPATPLAQHQQTEKKELQGLVHRQPVALAPHLCVTAIACYGTGRERSRIRLRSRFLR